ncbi:MAG: DMT family transporter [Phototrophicaceae bacterium]
MTIKALPFVLLTGFLFGSTLIASRFSVGQFHPLNYISFRLLLASSAHVLIYLFSQRSIPRDRGLWGRAALYGVFGTAVNLVGIVSALQFLSSGLVAILITSSPAITSAIAHFVLPEERLGIRQWLGIGFALSGAVLLAIAGENGLPNVSPNPLGYLFASTAILSGSIMTIYARQQLQGYDSFDTASIRMWVATLTVVPVTVIFVGFDLSNVDMNGIFAVLYAAFVGTFSGFLVQLYTISRFGAISASMVTYIIPLVTGIGGILILGEAFTPLMVVAIAIITTGILLVQREKLRKINPENS